MLALLRSRIVLHGAAQMSASARAARRVPAPAKRRQPPGGGEATWEPELSLHHLVIAAATAVCAKLQTASGLMLASLRSYHTRELRRRPLFYRAWARRWGSFLDPIRERRRNRFVPVRRKYIFGVYMARSLIKEGR